MEGMFIEPEVFFFVVSRLKKQGTAASHITLHNSASRPLGFKLKTNAPLRYSVKPVLGVVPGQGQTEIYVRCETCVLRGDRFLLQTVELLHAEALSLTPTTWRRINTTRFKEVLIPCIMATSPEDNATGISVKGMFNKRDSRESTESVTSSSKLSSVASMPGIPFVESRNSSIITSTSIPCHRRVQSQTLSSSYVYTDSSMSVIREASIALSTKDFMTLHDQMSSETERQVQTPTAEQRSFVQRLKQQIRLIVAVLCVLVSLGWWPLKHLAIGGGGEEEGEGGGRTSTLHDTMGLGLNAEGAGWNVETMAVEGLAG